MGRKRKPKYQAKVRSSAAVSVDDDAAVPDEVLAEGSGPAADGSVVARTAGEEIVELEAPDADAPPPTAEDLADILAVVESAESSEVEATAVAEAEPAGKKPKKRGRARAAADTQVDAAPPASEPVPEAEPSAVEAGAEAVAEEPPPGKKRRGRARTKSEAEPAAEALAAAAEAPSEDAAPIDAELADADADADADDDAERDADLDAEADLDMEAIDGDVPALQLVADHGETGGEIVEVPTEGVADDQLVEMTDEEALAAGAELPTSAATMAPEQLKHLVEALVFASDKPMTLLRLRQLTRISDTKRLEDTLATIAADYSTRGIVLQCVSGGYQFRTRTQFSAWVQQLIAGRPVRLSRAQLETLAIVAYRQPITRPEIDDIRGVDSSGTLKVLMDRTLIRILGKKEDVGRPMLYGTTKEFLDFFSLGDLRELPTLREYSELTDESRQVIHDRLGPVAAETDAATGDAASAADPAMLDADGHPIVDADLTAATESDGSVDELRADDAGGDVFASHGDEAGASLTAADGAEPARDDDAATDSAAAGEGAEARFDDAVDVDAVRADADADADAVDADAVRADAVDADAIGDDAVDARDADIDNAVEAAAAHHDEPPGMAYDDAVVAMMDDLAEGSDATVMAADERLAEMLAADGEEPMTAAGTGAMQAVDPSLIDELVGDPEATAVVDALSKDDADEHDPDPSFTDE